jgi:FkbM family methyltransferase
MLREVTTRAASQRTPHVGLRKKLYPLARWYAHRFPHRGTHAAVRMLHPLDASARRHAVTAEVDYAGAKMLVDTSDLIGWRLYFFGTYRPDRLAVLRTLHPGDVAFDIGASQGMFTLAMAGAVGATGFVHAFEPAPDEFRKLRANVALNPFANVALNPVALSDRTGDAILHVSEDSNRSASSLVSGGRDASTACRTVRLDDYTRDLTRLDFISLDAQGADLLVLRGAEETLNRFAPRLLLTSVCEPLYRAAGTSTGEIARFLTDRGYALRWIAPRSWRPRSGSDSIAVVAEPRAASRREAA